jgi:O-antigen ligase
VQVSDQSKPVIWVFISAFLAATAIFYAAMLGTNTQRRLELLMRGYLAAALIASLAAVAGYFHLLGGALDMFVLYDRARGTFNDPNVLGAFLVLPGLLVLQRMLAGRRLIRSTLMLLLMLAALLLSFSRGAWGQFAFAAALMMALTFVTSRSSGERLRILIVAVLGLVAVVVFVTALLSIPQVADLFKERATLEQSYDVGRFGRFGRYLLGADLALEHPLGIGPLQFARYFTEDAHNTFLNAFMSGGWLSGFAYLTLSVVTVAMATRFVFVRTPWQPIYHAVYAAYVGTVAESAIIDIDHWRHYFLILGVLWGLMAASRSYRRAG